jgi:serine/threonine-protein kinase RsbW
MPVIGQDGVGGEHEMNEVELRLPADATFVTLVRAVTTALGARCDLTLDQIDDLHLAVDEACALLLPHAEEGSMLTARFRLDAGRIEFRASVPAAAGSRPDRSGLSWAVLSALSDELRTSADGHELSVTVVKQRVALAP